MTKQQIRERLSAMKQENLTAIDTLIQKGDSVLLTDYASLSKKEKNGEIIWTDALQKALNEHEIVIIPASEEIYYIDAPVIIPSDRRIEAEGATLQLTKDCKTLMLRNEHTLDGTHAPIRPTVTDHNISICGGTFAESNTERLGYGKTGKYDEERSFFGVSTLLLFNNLVGLTLENVAFRHTAGFSLQAGDIKNAIFEKIRFDDCFADGLHLNGNSENLLISDIAGVVGDDLVALNMYDWQNSSINFGPTKWVLCENMELHESVGYKALRIEPGVYRYDDGSKVDCSLENAVFSDIRGILTYKMYFQTPQYDIGEDPEWGEVGSADNLFFENISVDLAHPMDGFENYQRGDPVTGAIGSFEIGANIGYLSFENISLTLHRDRYPHSHLVTVGPKSALWKGREVFDPYLSSSVGKISFSNITVNGRAVENPDELLFVAEFNDIHKDGRSTAKGSVGEILLDGKKIK